MYCPTVSLAKELITIPSISPFDYECQHVILKRLLALDFNIMLFKNKNTSNVWIYRGVGVTLSFAGHTDVVPPGNITSWKNHPFIPTIQNGLLFGRGSSDMKGSLAAMVIAAERFLVSQESNSGRLCFLITSDEESSAKDGTIRLVEYLQSMHEHINYCIVGEPTSSNIIGDTIKIGRRGSLHAYLCIHGKQGHIAYPHLADNPIHHSISFLRSLINTQWTFGNKYFTSTDMQIYHVHSGGNSENVIPGEYHVCLNFRFGTDISVNEIQNKLYALLHSEDFKYTITWKLSSKPFLTNSKFLIKLVQQSIQKINLIYANLSTDGGTSDGRFLRLISNEVLEIGLKNHTIHQVNEHVLVEDLQLLSLIYEDIIRAVMI